MALKFYKSNQIKCKYLIIIQYKTYSSLSFALARLSVRECHTLCHLALCFLLNL